MVLERQNNRPIRSDKRAVEYGENNVLSKKKINFNFIDIYMIIYL